MGVDRLPGRARGRDPDDRLGIRAVRRQATVDHGRGPVRARLGAVRARLVRGLTDRVPRASGSRRRDDHARRDVDPRAGRGPAADRPCDERRRRADVARADPRPGARRPDPPGALLAVDLLRQRSDRRARARARVADPAARRAAARRAFGFARRRAAVPGVGWDRVRALGDRDPRRDLVRRRMGADRGRGPARRRVRGPRAADARPTVARPPPVPRARVWRRGRVGAARRRGAVRRDAGDPAVPAGRPRRLHARHRAVDGPTGDRGRARDADLGSADRSHRRRARWSCSG